MKVQDLYDLMSRGKTVIIKPGGRRIYFEGSCNDIPNCMLQLPVIELEPIATSSSCALSIMVRPTPELNALVDCGVSILSKTEIDTTFNELIKERVVREKISKAAEGIAIIQPSQPAQPQKESVPSISLNSIAAGSVSKGRYSFGTDDDS